VSHIIEEVKQVRAKYPLRMVHFVDDIFNLTKIDRWFLTQLKEIVDFEEELARSRN
jgi:hypothetical protein